jgi:hypothetical protein
VRPGVRAENLVPFDLMKESRTFGHVVELLFFLLRLLLSPFRPISRLEAKNAALRRQLMVLQRQVRGRVQFTNSDRLFFLQLYRWFASIVKAMTTIPARDAGAMASRGFLSLLALEIPEPGRSAKMTNDEFDQAIEAIRQGQITPRERRVIAAAVFMIRELCSVPANWEPTNIQIVEIY